MSGHSKWATIHRKKGLIDAKRGQIFQKLAKEISIVARGTNGKIEENPNLRMIVEKAKAANMPKENINKAIEKAIGGEDTTQYYDITYEGYSSGGVSLMVECLTDNKNRTASFVRSTFTKYGGNLGTSGSVSYMFKRKGLIVISKDLLDEDTALMVALNNKALDVKTEDDYYIIYTEPEDFLACKEAFTLEGVKDFLESEVTFIPDNYLKLEGSDLEKTNDLIETLESLDDVQNVYHNLEEE